MKPFLPLALLGLALATPALAQDGAAAAPRRRRDRYRRRFDHDRRRRGVSARLRRIERLSHRPRPRRDRQYKGFSFLLAGNRAERRPDPQPARPGRDFQLGPVAVVNFNRTSLKSIDDPRVRALGKLDTAIELGGYVGIGKTGVITSPYDKLERVAQLSP